MTPLIGAVALLLGVLPGTALLVEVGGTESRQQPASASAPATRQRAVVQRPPLAAVVPSAQQCKVPDLTGGDLAKARALLMRAGFTLGQVQSRPSDEPRGTIVSQTPKAQTSAVCRSAIDLWVAAVQRPGRGGGPDAGCEVPELTGRPVEESRGRLAKAKLQLGALATEESDRRPDTVLRQSPSAGAKIACGSRVALVVSVAVKDQTPPTESLCAVPELTGRPVEESRTRLIRAKLQIGAVATEESDRRPDTVLRQSPAAGAKIACGSRVALVVAVAAPSSCVVPALLNPDVKGIEQELRRAGLALGSVNQEPGRGRGGIARQQPRAGATVACRSKVDVWLTTTMACGPVPGLIALDVETAAAALTERGLRLGDVQERESSRAARAIVDQAPAAGTEARCDTPVRVWVATPPAGVAVPLLRGDDEATARAKVERAGLTLTSGGSRPSEQAAGSVVDQMPTAGTVVRRGTAVQVWTAVAQPVTVPDLRGQDQAAADAALTAARLSLGRIAERLSERPAGTVVEQLPAPGTVVRPGTTVQVWTAVPPPATVPDLVGQSQAAASAALTAARLSLGRIAEHPSDRPAGTIVEQAPVAGSVVQRGTVVQVWTAVPQPATVPDLRGQYQAAADAALTAARLSLGRIAERPSERPVGTVVEQLPAPGIVVSPGTSVQVWTAVPPPATVPDLVGQSQAAAAAALTAARLSLGRVAERPSDRPAGTIVEQAPAAGSIVQRGTVVQVWTAVPNPTPVPDLRGQDQAAAAATLTSARLNLGQIAERPSDRPAGTVVEQSPAPGTVVRPGTSVQVWTAVPIPATVPDVNGRSQAAAAEALTTARLRIGTVTEQPSERPAGTIVDQTPDAGTVVRPGTPVQVSIAVALPATVPDLSGRDRTAAMDALTAARLRVGEIAERSSERATGTVVEQQPPAGSRVAADTLVQIWLAVAVTNAVPDLTGRARAEAERTLSQLGLVVGAVTEEPSPGTAGTVVRQRPVAGVQARRGDVVDLVFATTVTTVPAIQAPDLSGRSEAEARAVLEAAGLRAGAVNRVRSTAFDAGTIAGQSPSAGAALAPGAAVDFALAEAATGGWPWMLAGVALGLAAAGVATKVMRRGHLPRGLTFTPHADGGVQSTISAGSGRGPAAVELSLQGCPDRGVQTLHVTAPPLDDAAHAR